MKRILKALAYSSILTAISLISVSLLWNYTYILTGFLLIISAAMLSVWRSKEDLYLYVFCGITGALCETVAIYFGAWAYAAPNILGVPYWLFPLWGTAAIFMKRIGLEIHDFVKNPPKT